MVDAVKLEDLTIFNAMSTRELLIKSLSEGKTDFDLSDVGEIDSSGIQLLIALQKQAQQDGKTIHLHEVSEPVKELVKQYGIAELVGIAA